MVNSVRSRLGDQHGFTLIELLVVMIIIAILMAVAVPVFLGQKQKALATQAKTNAKHIQDTIESCAAGTTNGSLSQATLNCVTVAQVTSDEQSLSPILTANMGCGAAACISIVAGVAPETATSSYVIQSRTVDLTGTFNLTRTSTNVLKSCTFTVLNNKARMCPTGSW